MRETLKYGFVAVALLAVLTALGLFSVSSTEVPAVLLASDSSQHMASCSVCRLPMYGAQGKPSHFGPAHPD